QASRFPTRQRVRDPQTPFILKNPESRRLRIPPRAVPESSFLSRQKSFDALAIIRQHIPRFPTPRLQPHPNSIDEIRRTNPRSIAQFTAGSLQLATDENPPAVDPSIPPLRLPQSISGFPANPLR
ncbi:hypothetical protein VDGL01_01935, partial [Verticillium dahliae]